MSKQNRGLGNSLWSYRWWLLVPFGILTLLLLLLLLLSDSAEDAPFQYMLF